MNSRRMLLGMAVAIPLLAINAGIAYFSLRELSENHRRTTHTHRVLASLEETHSLLLDAESGKCNFLIVADPVHLIPIDNAAIRFADRLRELRSVTGDNPRHQARLDRLQVLAGEKLRELQDTVAARQTSVDAAHEVARTHPGRQAMHHIRKLIDEMRAEEQALLEQRSAGSHASLAGARSTLVFSSLADFVLVGVALALFRRDTRTRERAEKSLREYAEALEVANRNLSRYCQEAEAATRAKSEFLANMSHEIRTPMTAILGHAELLLSGVRNPSEQRAGLQAIHRNGEHLLQIINDILDLSKIEAGKLSIERTGCAPARVLEDIRSMMQDRAAARQLSLECELSGPVPAEIQSDPTRLRQILINLVGNAIKFTERGGVRLVCRMENASTTAAPRLCFDVIDTGIGIPADKLEQLFQPFAQVDNSPTRRFGGTGLGLFISRYLAEALGGTIEVASAPGQGSCFTLALACGTGAGASPMDAGEVARETQTGAGTPRAELSPDETARLADRRILLAEDGPDNQYLFSLHLRTAGIEVDVVDNGRLAVEHALAAARAHRPYDLILMDMQMPELDGYSAAGSLRAAGYSGRIVALTAHAMQGDREKCLHAGCDEYVTKPVTRLGLLRAVAANVPDDRPSGPVVKSKPADSPVRSTVPLHSEYADDPLMVSAIGRFVSRIPDRVESLLKAASERDRVTLLREAHQLKGAAGGYGFRSLSVAAAALEQEVRESGDRADFDLPALQELVELCRRATLPRDVTPSEREHAAHRFGD